MNHYSKRSSTLQERMVARTGKRGPRECWEWMGSKTACGYGQIWFGGRMQKAHRVALALARGHEIEADLCVLHSCHNRACVNPAHLRTGTHAENMADMVAAGRQSRGNAHRMACPRGEAHGMATLSDAQIAEIHSCRAGGLSHGEIAALVGCSRRYVGKVLSGEKRSGSNR